jgi:hypothetical protein
MKFAAVVAACAVAVATAVKEVAYVGAKSEPLHVDYVGDVTSGNAVLTFSKCGTDNFVWSAGPAVKGSSVTVTGTGTIGPTTSGSYNVQAAYGSLSLCNQNANLGTPLNVDISVLGNDFGHMTTTPFAVPTAGSVSITINLPVPNIGGTVTGQTTGTSSSGQLWCVNLNMAL